MDDPERTASLMTPAKLAQVTTKSAASPAAWLDQMASDAGHAQVRRLAELCDELQAQGRARDLTPLASRLTGLGEALPRLNFGLLQDRGWWARTTGRARTAGADFVGQFERIETSAKDLLAQAQALRKQQQEQASANERTLVEVEVEFRATDKIIDQGARWLNDMRNQLKARQATASDEQSQQQIRDDTARCEILVARLKVLRAASSAAQQSHQQSQAAAAGRMALLQSLQQAVAPDVKSWQVRLTELAGVAGDSTSPALSLEGPMEAHQALQLCVKRASAQCVQLRAQEQALAEALAALGTQLEAMC